MKKLFCFGYGYTCDYLGYELLERGGWQVAGTTRDREKRTALRARGIQAHLFDHEHPLADPQLILKDTTHLVISTPPDDDGDPAFLMHEHDILNIPTLEWVGYLSTTGVYGDRGGGVATEEDPISPSARRGSRRVRAEEQWLSLQKESGLPVHVFRIAGIYGPGRSALDSVRAGVARRINKPGHAFGRVHVEDIVQTLLASFERPNPGSIYNVIDNLPAPSHEVIEYACKLLERPVPPLVDFEEANLAPITRSFYMENRRTSNAKIKSELGLQLRYPDFKAGLRGCLEAETHAVKTLFSGMAEEEATTAGWSEH